MKRVFILTLTLMSVFAASCGVERQKVSREDAIRYYLNQGQYEEAIVLLKEQIAENPKDDRSRVTLASAYSGSVGINTIDCFDVLKPKLFDSPLDSSEGGAKSNFSARLKGDDLSTTDGYSFFDAPESKDETELTEEERREEKQRKAILRVEKELYNFLLQSSEALETAFKLPHVSFEKRDRIVLSLKTLASISADSSEYESAQLYSGILGMIQFLNYFRDAVPPPTQTFKNSRWFIAVFCQLDLAKMMPNLNRSTEYLIRALKNFTNAERKSGNPVFDNLSHGVDSLSLANDFYLMNQDLFEFTDWSMKIGRSQICEGT